MTELEFKNTNPTSYDEGNANLLYSSSIGTGSYELPEGKYGASGSFDYDQVLSNVQTGGNGMQYYLADALFPPYRVLGLTIPFKSSNDVSLEQTLSQVTGIKLTMGNLPIKLVTTEISKQAGYFFIRTQPTDVFSLPVGTDQAGTPLDLSVEFIFAPYLADKFSNSDFNALIGNASTNSTSTVAMVVDREGDQLKPTNLGAIISQTATKASVQYSNYTTTGWTNARYHGTSLNSGSIFGEDPAMTLKVFQGSVHPLDASAKTIINAVEQHSDDIYYNDSRLPTDYVSSSVLYVTSSTFPTTRPSNYGTKVGGVINLNRGSILYESRGNRFVRIVDKKILATDISTVFTTNEFGNIIKSVSGTSGSAS
jgi:hypothetical protein